MSRFQAEPGTLLHVQMGNPCLGAHLSPPQPESTAAAQTIWQPAHDVTETSPKADQATRITDLQLLGEAADGQPARPEDHG